MSSRGGLNVLVNGIKFVLGWLGFNWSRCHNLTFDKELHVHPADWLCPLFTISVIFFYFGERLHFEAIVLWSVSNDNISYLNEGYICYPFPCTVRYLRTLHSCQDHQVRIVEF